METFGRPALGGPWSLVGGDGRPVTSGDLAGQYYLLYFGFTFCPDICPSELVKMSRVVDAMDGWVASAAGRAARAPPLQPVFVTLDPRRDSCEQVRSYVHDFHPRMLGLTGTPGQLAKIAKSFRVYFQGVDAGESGESEDYLGALLRQARSAAGAVPNAAREQLPPRQPPHPPSLPPLAVDHSIVMYLVGPDGSFLDFFVQSATASEVAAKIQAHMRAAAAAT